MKLISAFLLFQLFQFNLTAQESDSLPGTSSQPRIIYYQSTPDDKSSSSSFYTSKRNRKDEIKTLSGSMNHSGGFFGLSFRSTEFRDETMVLAGFRTGWIVNRTLGIGIEGHGIIPTAKYTDIDPLGNVVALGGYGGMFLEMILFSNQVIHLTFPVSSGAGWMGYTSDWETNNNNYSTNGIIDEDVFWYVEPGANIEVNISRNFRLAAGMSKRFIQDLTLINTATNAFDKPSFYITLKLGSF